MMHSIDVARTHEILARYRPIAPKPALPSSATGSAVPPQKDAAPTTAVAAAGLRHLQPRASRSRKRGRAGCSCVAFAATAQKRPKTYVPAVFSPPHHSAAGETSLPLLAHKTSPLGLSLHCFARSQRYPVLPLSTAVAGNNIENPPAQAGNNAAAADLPTLSLLPYFASSRAAAREGSAALDLNSSLETAAAPAATAQKEPSPPDLKILKPHVIVPQPVRPIGSSISVGSISDAAAGLSPPPPPPAMRKTEEVEEEVESEVLPAVVSDGNNRVRLANSAYKEMVGQPECPWLASMIVAATAGAGRSSVVAATATRRINGEVMLDFSGGSAVPAATNGFSCRVRIEWVCNGRKSFVNAACDVVRLFCESKDYLFAWRFHTITT